MNIDPALASVEKVATIKQLDAVKEIHREHKSILGQMPDGAFDDRFANGQIYLANIENAAAGYVLFWRNRSDEIRIAHLAVRKSCQRLGVANALLDHLKQNHSTCSRIRLNCRSDFAAAQIWPKLDFVACGRKPAKQPGKELTIFQYRLDDTPLFDICEDAPHLPVVVCDTNVCMDIEYSERDNHESSSGLLADWLVDQIELRVTEEILNDLDRQDQLTRSRMTSVVQADWDQVDADPDEVRRYRAIVREVLGKAEREDDLSDEKHLAIAAAVKAAAFATRDRRILNAAPELLEKIGLRVQRPSEIIAELDSLQSSGKPHFGDLKNAGIFRTQVTSVGDVDAEQFLKSTRGETIGEFRRYLDDALAAPKTYRVDSIKNGDGEQLAFIVVRRSKESEHRVERLRIAHRCEGTRLGGALVEHLAERPLGCTWSNAAVCRKSTATVIEDPVLSGDLARSCFHRGFSYQDGELIRISMPGTWTHAEFEAQLDQLLARNAIQQSLASRLRTLAALSDPAAIRELEQRIHPGKVTFGDLSNWIVPIQPEWAQELFDIRIWNRPLFAAETNLAINPDSVYYKRPRNSPTGEYGRILWYVSGDAEKGGNSIRACSMMTKRVTGPIKDVYRQYERMGVFEWKQIKEHFGKATSEAVAIEFTDTELLPHPINFTRANQILVQTGMKANQFQSALRITAPTFHQLYDELTKAN
ncbi:GNAT family N-acetyltransferase [Rhodopirellula sp. P2]|uniref:GNAT family N-acetyltransferase n=1 Tax=Rhodopirellula sp. P2 TaxID=2127060 RepID=UPI0023687E9F|nr:GNAT family N-acetyltransferase [Rhodopirellula sp. P2]WDQ16781.1 GNAT family N-acetyltransferase [Rhodopirellula sp. P2]